jgi:hypothetical protein
LQRVLPYCPEPVQRDADLLAARHSRYRLPTMERTHQASGDRALRRKHFPGVAERALRRMAMG